MSIFICCLQTQLMTILDCTFLLIHLCYYIITYYITLLTLNLENCNRTFQSRPIQMPFKRYDFKYEIETLLFNVFWRYIDCLFYRYFRCRSNGMLKTFNKSVLVFEHICNISSELQCFFSFPVLIILVTKFITVIGTAFTCLLTLLNRSTTFDDTNILLLFTSTTDWIRIMIILSSADMPIYQVRTILELKSLVFLNFRILGSIVNFRFNFFANGWLLHYTQNLADYLLKKCWFVNLGIQLRST